MEGPGHYAEASKLMKWAKEELSAGNVAEAAVHAQMAMVESQLALTMVTASTLPEGHPDQPDWDSVRRNY